MMVHHRDPLYIYIHSKRTRLEIIGKREIHVRNLDISRRRSAKKVRNYFFPWLENASSAGIPRRDQQDGGGIAVADRLTAFCITMCLVYKITIPRLIRPLLSPLPTPSLAHFPTGRRFHGSKARIHAERERSSERRQLARVIDRPVNEAKIFAWREEIRATKRAQTRLRRSVHNLDLCNRNPLAASVDHHSDSSVHVVPSKVGTRSRRDHQGNRNGQE